MMSQQLRVSGESWASRFSGIKRKDSATYRPSCQIAILHRRWGSQSLGWCLLGDQLSAPTRRPKQANSEWRPP